MLVSNWLFENPRFSTPSRAPPEGLGFALVLPAGIEPALRAPEARVLSIKLREQVRGPLNYGSEQLNYSHYGLIVYDQH